MEGARLYDMAGPDGLYGVSAARNAWWGGREVIDGRTDYYGAHEIAYGHPHGYPIRVQKPRRSYYARSDKRGWAVETLRRLVMILDNRLRGGWHPEATYLSPDEYKFMLTRIGEKSPIP